MRLGVPDLVKVRQSLGLTFTGNYWLNFYGAQEKWLQGGATWYCLLPSGELDPTRLAILGDALEEAGSGAELLEHLRTPGPHVRGCYVVDLILSHNRSPDA